MTTASPATHNPGSDRTWLFVPGPRPDRFEKAWASGCDQVICDLEDSVHERDKVAARAAVRDYLASDGRAWVRINPRSTPWFADDLEALAGLSGLLGLMVPKAESRAELDQARSSCGEVRLMPLIESALGVHRVLDIATAPGVERLAFGSVDLALDLGCHETPAALNPARSALVLASRVAGLSGPIDGVTTSIDHLDDVSADARAAKELGFAGKLCIHPAQVSPIRDVFAPTPDELAWATEVMSAGSGGVGTVRGQMVDKPVLARAARLLRLGSSE